MATSPVFRWWVLFVVLIFQLGSSMVIVAVSVTSSWKVKYLPGFSGALPFELETGYIGVGDSEEVELFYYFVKSKGSRQTDPLITWFTGGPGCSALSGLAFEIGPLNFKVESYNGTLPQLILNPHTWAKNASIIFVDSPVGTGFSYSRTPQGSKRGDFLQVKHNHQFFRKWLANHPEFISNPFYVGGDSYSGMIVPPLTQAIAKGNKNDIPVINLQGYIVGNPVSVRETNDNSRIPYAHRMSLISTELYKSLTSNCKGEYENVDPNNVECIKHVSNYKKCVGRINHWCLSCPYCQDVSSAPQDNFGQRRSLYNTSKQVFLALRMLPPPSLDCQEYKYYLSLYWANDNQVRKALHIRKGTVGEWIRCQSRLGYHYDIETVVPYHANLSSNGYRSLVFSGDHDLIVPIIDTEAWINSLNYPITDDWRPWFNSKYQILGYTRTYANKMTFATIKGGGHTPEFMQYQSGIMFNRWIAGELL